MPERPRSISEESLARFLDALDGNDTEAKCDALTALCPCRSRVYDRDGWLAILHAGEWGETEQVRDRAHHALDSLRERVPIDPEAEALVRWLAPHDGTGRLRRRTVPPITARAADTIIEALAEGDVETQCELLEALCPCRNRIYSRDVWRAIFDLRDRTESPTVRDKASHAIGTLQERVRTDPRSQELAGWLADEVDSAAFLGAAIPVWNPRSPRKGPKLPPIPRFERGHRSRPNKQK